MFAIMHSALHAQTKHERRQPSAAKPKSIMHGKAPFLSGTFISFFLSLPNLMVVRHKLELSENLTTPPL